MTGPAAGWVTIPGILLVLIALQDMFDTVVLFGRSHGYVGITVMRIGWWLFSHAISPARRSGQRLMTYAGPSLFVAHVFGWVVLLWFGYAFITWPALGTAIISTTGTTHTDFVSALYYSGYNLSTLGVGTIEPVTGTYRLVLVSEGFIGIAALTSGFTYLVTLTSATIQRNTFAAQVFTLMGSHEDAIELVVRLGPGGDFSMASGTLSTLSTGVLNTLQSQRAYPMLRYFHLIWTYETLPHMLLVPLDTVALLRAGLDSERYRTLLGSAALSGVWEGALHMLNVLDRSLVPPYRHDTHQPSPQEEQRWRARFREALQRMRDAGIQVTDDPDAGADHYVELRRVFHARVLGLSEYMAYPPEVEGIISR